MTTPMRSPLVSALAVALLSVPSVAYADAVDDLEPGTWYAIPDTKMREVCPPDTENYEWSYHCQSAITAWNGATLDTTRSRMIVWGGGHADYRGNEVYVFDMTTLAWERVWGPTPDAQIPSGGTHEAYDDGNPGSRHTYSGIMYVPEPHDALYSFGGSLWQTGFLAAGVWSFSFTDNAWTRHADTPSQMGFGDPTIYDPQTGHIFRRANTRMLEYVPETDESIERAPSDGGFWAPNVSAAFDPDRRLMVMIGEGRVDTYALDTDTYVQDLAIDGASVSDLFGGMAPGLDFDPEQQRFVVYGGGLDLHTFDPDTASFSVHPNTGDDPGPVTGSGGAFGRFRYVPSRNVFVWIDSVDQDVHVVRTTKGSGMPPDPGGTDTDTDTSGSESGDGDSTGVAASTSDTSSMGSGGIDSTSSGPNTSGPGTGDTDDTASVDDGDGGCGCRSTPMDATPSALLLLGLLGIRRRRATVAVTVANPTHARARSKPGDPPI